MLIASVEYGEEFEKRTMSLRLRWSFRLAIRKAASTRSSILADAVDLISNTVISIERREDRQPCAGDRYVFLNAFAAPSPVDGQHLRSYAALKLHALVASLLS